MLVNDILEVEKGCLYSVKWEGEDLDSLDQFVSMMDDNMQLWDYLKTNSSYLFSGYYSHSIESAIMQIRSEYEELLDEMYRRAQNGPLETVDCLERIFHPLDNRKILINYKLAKAKYDGRKPILRIYGYKMDKNCVIISGYGIKLTPKMDDHPDLVKEKMKLNALRRYIDKHRISF